jgi:hypothetical protein
MMHDMNEWTSGNAMWLWSLGALVVIALLVALILQRGRR